MITKFSNYCNEGLNFDKNIIKIVFDKAKKRINNANIKITEEHITGIYYKLCIH